MIRRAAKGLSAAVIALAAHGATAENTITEHQEKWNQLRESARQERAVASQNRSQIGGAGTAATGDEQPGRGGAPDDKAIDKGS